MNATSTRRAPSLRPLVPIVAAALGTAIGAPAAAETLDFTITIDGFQEQPPVETTGSGSGTATFDTDTNLFSWNIVFGDLEGTPTAAHFHGAAPLCESAGVRIGLVPSSPITGSQVLTDAEAAELLGGLWYVNIHSDLHPGGEIRGQVMPSGLADPIPAAPADSTIHVRLEEVATGLTAPNWGVAAPGHPNHLFVSDQAGTLWSIEPATGTKTAILDVSNELVELGVFGPNSFDERGLLGVAFRPDFATSGALYTYTSEPATGTPDFTTMPAGMTGDHHTVVREWFVFDPSDPTSMVDPASARTLLRIEQPQFNHNAGAMAFGPGDLLHIALGDGGGADDQDGQAFMGEAIAGHGCLGNGADPTTILGSIIRIDPQGDDSANGMYGIPATNPFVGDPGGLDEIWAFGFRNPFRMAFDEATGDLYVADVGQNDLEEITIVVPGGHHGWRHREGTRVFIPNGVEPGYVTDREIELPAGLIDPIAEYDHDEGLAIIGGFVYRGTRIAPLAGRYVFGEFAQTFSADGRLFHLDEANDVVEFPLVGADAVGAAVLGMAQDASGELYVLVNDSGIPFGDSGRVLRITTKTGDLDADGVTDFNDLLELLANWGPCPGCPADLDGDDDVDFDDLLLMLANWG